MSRHVRFEEDGSDRLEAIEKRRKEEERLELERLKVEARKRDREREEENLAFLKSAMETPGITDEMRVQLAQTMIRHGSLEDRYQVRRWPIAPRRLPCRSCGGEGTIQRPRYIERERMNGVRERYLLGYDLETCEHCSGSGTEW